MQSESSIWRNNERRNEVAKRSFKRVISIENGALAISLDGFDFLVRFVSRQNEHKENI